MRVSRPIERPRFVKFSSLCKGDVFRFENETLNDPAVFINTDSFGMAVRLEDGTVYANIRSDRLVQLVPHRLRIHTRFH